MLCEKIKYMPKLDFLYVKKNFVLRSKRTPSENIAILKYSCAPLGLHVRDKLFSGTVNDTTFQIQRILKFSMGGFIIILFNNLMYDNLSSYSIKGIFDDNNINISISHVNNYLYISFFIIFLLGVFFLISETYAFLLLVLFLFVYFLSPSDTEDMSIKALMALLDAEEITDETEIEGKEI